MVEPYSRFELRSEQGPPVVVEAVDHVVGNARARCDVDADGTPGVCDAVAIARIRPRLSGCRQRDACQPARGKHGYSAALRLVDRRLIIMD